MVPVGATVRTLKEQEQEHERWVVGGSFDCVGLSARTMHPTPHAWHVWGVRADEQTKSNWRPLIGCWTGLVGVGAPGGDVYCPRCCDTTLQVRAAHVLPACWSCAGHVLPVRWPCAERVLTVCCDTTLQEADVWFYQPGQGIRPLAELIKVYHQTVGRNGVLEMDFAIDRTGKVAPSHEQRYTPNTKEPFMFTSMAAKSISFGSSRVRCTNPHAGPPYVW